jgi:phosphopantothenoylcysteine synthetase/decarboxylase
MQETKKLLIGITGTIGALSVPSYLHVLRENFTQIKIIMTESAESFIPKESISLILEGVQSTVFPASKGEMTHVQLGTWADLFIVLPVSAHTIAQVAHGFAGNLLTLAILAHKYPVLFFPNMNRFMWDKPAVQRNVAQLIEDGHQIISPIERVSYEHATGDRNTGKHLPSPQDVLKILEAEIEKRQTAEHLLGTASLQGV